MELTIKETALSILTALKLEKPNVRVHRKTEKEEVENTIERYYLEIITTEAPLLIGRHGENLDAFKHILKIIINKKAFELERKVALFVDVDGYLQQKDEQILNLARRRATQVLTNGNLVKLQSMSSYTRRLIHLELRKPEWDGLTTESIGEGKSRTLIIKKI
jgi:spoIIIJ-associated protein